MESPQRQLARSLVAVPAAVTAARHAVVAFAEQYGASSLTRENLALAVSEAVANAVMHAYVGAPKPGPVHVRASAAGDALLVVVADDGRGMEPRVGNPGLGMGLSLMSQVSTQFQVRESRTGGVELHMTFAL